MSAEDALQSSAPSAAGRQYWRPPPDEALTWFRVPEGIVPTRPRPLEATLAAPAFAFGLTHGLISLYFPLSEVRARVFGGHLYLAPVPSPLAERDPNEQLRRARDSSLRFSHNLRGAWEGAGRAEVEEYNRRLATAPPADASDEEVAAALLRLRRDRGNQWFVAIRMGAATPALLRARGDPFPVDDARLVLAEVRELVLRRGSAELTGAVERIGERLVRRGSLATPEDVYWLTLDEVQAAFRQGGDQRCPVELRRATAVQAGAVAPEVIGPPLPPDAPRISLLRQVLSLLAGETL